MYDVGTESHVTDIVLRHLPPVARDVHLLVQEGSPNVFVIALAKMSLPWRERFIHGQVGTWEMTSDEVEEMVEGFVRDVLIPGGKDRGFFKVDVLTAEGKDDPGFKDIPAPDPTVLEQTNQTLALHAKELEERNENLRHALKSIKDALDYVVL